jgi:hypothetical protein
MTRPNTWSVETVFATMTGFLMAAFFAGACFIGQRPPPIGSHLVPAAVLEKLVHNGRFCQTLTDEEVSQNMPPRHC